MRTRGKGVKKSKKIADVINGSSLAAAAAVSSFPLRVRISHFIRLSSVRFLVRLDRGIGHEAQSAQLGVTRIIVEKLVFAGGDWILLLSPEEAELGSIVPPQFLAASLSER